MNNSPPFGNQAKYKTQCGQRVKTTILEVHASQARPLHGPPFEKRKRARGRIRQGHYTDWKTKAHSYCFGLFKDGPLSVQAVKHSDKTMKVLVEGLGEEVFSTRKPIPVDDQATVMVGFTWTEGKAIFYLNGILVDTKETQIKA